TRRSGAPAATGPGRGSGTGGAAWKAPCWTAAILPQRCPSPHPGAAEISAKLPAGQGDGPHVRIISFNANGIRSAASKGFFDWLPGQDADIVCIQETKAQEHQLAAPDLRPAGYQAFFRDATTRKGYSGVAIYTRREPDQVLTGLGWEEFDEEGRYLEARFGNLSVVSLY